MSLVEDLVRRSLGDVSAEVKRKLIRELEGIGKEFVSSSVADAVSRALIKSLDGVVKAAVKQLSPEESQRLCAAYLAEIQDQLQQLSDALLDYLPFAVSVEMAKQQFGDKSQQAEEARRTRKVFMDSLRGEVKDTFRAVAGQEPTD